MIYKLTFLESAKKEWDKLDLSLQKQFKKKLIERLKNPYIAKDKLFNLENCYKIKLRSSGYRLVYKVTQKKIRVQVIAVGKRNREEVYKLVRFRIT